LTSMFSSRFSCYDSLSLLHSFPIRRSSDLILFTLIATMAAPFFGREVLMWIVDMSSLGVTIAYFYACFVACRLFKWSDKQDVPKDRKSTRLNSSHVSISYALFCLKNKNIQR